jgi:hypothetical protein
MPSSAASLPPPFYRREREAVMSKRRAEAEQARIKDEKERVAAQAVNLQPHPEDQKGFIPFYSE